MNPVHVWIKRSIEKQKDRCTFDILISIILTYLELSQWNCALQCAKEAFEECTTAREAAVIDYLKSLSLFEKELFIEQLFHTLSEKEKPYLLEPRLKHDIIESE